MANSTLTVVLDERQGSSGPVDATEDGGGQSGGRGRRRSSGGASGGQGGGSSGQQAKPVPAPGEFVPYIAQITEFLKGVPKIGPVVDRLTDPLEELTKAVRDAREAFTTAAAAKRTQEGVSAPAAVTGGPAGTAAPPVSETEVAADAKPEWAKKPPGSAARYFAERDHARGAKPPVIGSTAKAVPPAASDAAAPAMRHVPPMARAVIPTATAVAAPAAGAAGAAAGGATAAAGGAVTGGATAAAGGALAAIAAAALPVAAVLAVVGAALAVVGPIVSKLAETVQAAITAIEQRIADQTQSYADYSGQLAASQARISAERIRQDREQAQLLGGRIGAFNEQRDRISRSLEKILNVLEAAALTAIVPVMRVIASLLEKGISIVSAIVKAIDKLTDMIPGVKQIKEALAAILEWLLRDDGKLPPEADILRAFAELAEMTVEFNGTTYGGEGDGPQTTVPVPFGPRPGVAL